MVKKNNLKVQSISLINGFILGSMVAITSLSYASLIFSGSLQPYIGYGVSAAFWGSGILLLIMALFSSSKKTIAGPQDTFALITVITVLSILTTFEHSTLKSNPLPTVLCIVFVMALSFGVVTYFLGAMRLGRLIRYIPFPVIGGFLAGTGWLLLISTMQAITSQSTLFDLMQYLLSCEHLSIWLIPLCFGSLLLLFEYYFNSAHVFPALLILSYAAFYCYLAIHGISFIEARQTGWLLGPFPEGNVPLLPSKQLLIDHVEWSLVLQHGVDYLAVTVLGVICMLLNISSFEMLTKQTMNIDRELKFTGLANILVAMVGGFGGYQFLFFSKVAMKNGTQHRFVAIVASFFCFSFLLLGTRFLSTLPNFLFYGFLIYGAFDLIVEWFVAIKQKISWLDYAIVLLITFSIVAWGLLVGIVLGLLLALLIFFFRYSRIPVLDSLLFGKTLHSNVERNTLAKKALDQHGRCILIASVQGYLFFGNAYDMATSIFSYFGNDDNSQMPIRFLIINLNHVTGIEVSGTMSFINILHQAKQNQISVLFTHLPLMILQEIDRLAKVENEQLIYNNFIDLDHALEWCENEILQQYKADYPKDTLALFYSTFPEVNVAESLLAYAEKFKFKEGELVCDEGESANDLFWVVSGTIDIIIGYGSSNAKRLRRVQSGAIFGEMALYLQQPRSASVVAATDCSGYRFSEEAITTLTKQEPALAAVFHKSIVTILARRLNYSNRLIYQSFYE